MSRDFSSLRESYQQAGLRRADLADDPVTQFGRWWDDWMASAPYDPAACVLATADADGRPSARYVLCRAADVDGFTVYTNFESRKGRELAANPYASLVFGWIELGRQVRVEGPVTLVDDDEADTYWETRPRGSRISAWASDQSEVLADRQELLDRRAEVAARFGEDESDPPIPRPEFWGGYRIGIARLELWQGRPDRLHDRFAYTRSEDGTTWQVDRLAP